MAIVHSLDNPFASLSTTFEAIQAVMKLATQMEENMRDTSSVWAPPVYRRLLSDDKREREMCLRCLLKIKHLVVPSPLALSKVIARDMKLRLLPQMKELLKHGKKVETLQAWRWFSCILGSYSLKTRHLVNEMLKVTEQTFSDPDPQTQNASLVAWEGLIDALVYLPSKVCHVTSCQHQAEQNREKVMDSSKVSGGGIVQTGRCSKILKLIMTPLIGIMTSKADPSVQSSCLSTWCYLLHKLDSLVNDPCVLDSVVDPMFKLAFDLGPEDRNIWIRRFCINLLQDFIQAKITFVEDGSLNHFSCNLPARVSDSGTVSGEYSLKIYSIKWLPWDCSQMDFLVRMLKVIFDQTAVVSPYLESRRLVCDTALKMFHNFLKGVQRELAKLSTTYSTVMQCINGVLMFVRTVCETLLHGNDATDDFQSTCLQILGAVNQELDPSLLGSSLYKVSLDLKYISDLQLVGENRWEMLVGTIPIGLMDMVPPVVYLTVLYSAVVVQVSYKEAGTGCTLQEAYNYFNNLLSAYDSLEVIHAVVVVLYTCVKRNSLLVWTTLAKSLRDYINTAKDLSPLKIQPASPGSLTVYHLLLYPFVVCSLREPLIALEHCRSTASITSSENLVYEQITELWVSLYCLVNSSHQLESPRMNLFAEDLCSSLKGFLQRIFTSDSVKACNSSQEHHLLSLCGDVVKCILENLQIDKVTAEAIKCGFTGESGITSCLEFTAWVMKLLWTENGEPCATFAMSRLLPPLTQIVGSLQWQKDIFSLNKVLADPLLLWLSDVEMKCESIKHELGLLWTEIIRSLQSSWPAIAFDSSFLRLQTPLLEKALDHPSPSISEPTITFWNSAYGDQNDLDFPPCLLQILDKLSRLGKIKVKIIMGPALARDKSSLEAVNSRHRYKVTATLHTCSKRVELSEDVMDGQCDVELPPCPKRKRSELTDHQREVRRAQQGKGRDCGGHGPGIRTYTSVDFSQGNDDSQDTKDIRDPELILYLLKRAA